MDVRRVEAIKNGTQVIGNRTRVKVIKNKVAPPFKEAMFDIMYGEGISHFSEMIDIGVELDLVTKSGSWFSIDGERIGQGRDNARQFLMDNPDMAEELEAKIRQKLFSMKQSGTPTAEPEEPDMRQAPAAYGASRGVSIGAEDFIDED